MKNGPNITCTSRHRLARNVRARCLQGASPSGNHRALTFLARRCREVQVMFGPFFIAHAIPAQLNGLAGKWWPAAIATVSGVDMTDPSSRRTANGNKYASFQNLALFNSAQL